jgi:hypothetical protein
MDLAAKLAVAPGACEVPFCIIPRYRREEFAKAVEHSYETLSDEFVGWLARETDLVVAWIMGFKPAGEDARPDRGLPPLARMLLGREADLLTVIYGPARASMWEQLEREPESLGVQNGLWQSIFACSNAILVDSKTDKGITRKGYTSAHWQATTVLSQVVAATTPSPDAFPLVVSEQDIDTVIHLMMSSLTPLVFEGLCNPPGGDWSGISLLSEDGKCEHRWLSLPRVSNTGAKRPDHVFQLQGTEGQSHVLVIESKQSWRNLERNIGPRLVAYVRELIRTPASAMSYVESQLKANTSAERLNDSSLVIVSGVAFLVDSADTMAKIGQQLEADVLFGLRVSRPSTTVWIKSTSEEGSEVARILRTYVPEKHLGIDVVVL